MARNKPTPAQAELIRAAAVEGGVNYWRVRRDVAERCLTQGWIRKDRALRQHDTVLRATQKGLDDAHITRPDVVFEGDLVVTPEGYIGVAASIPFDGISAFVELLPEYRRSVDPPRPYYDRCVLERAAKFDVGADVQLLPRGRFGVIKEVKGGRLKIEWEDGSVLWHPQTDVKAVEWYDVTIEARITIPVRANSEADAKLAVDMNWFEALKNASTISHRVFVDTKRRV